MVATNPETGFTTRATAGADGSYVLTGLRPGPYDIVFTTAGGVPVTRQVVVSVGETATLDFDAGAPGQGVAEAGAGPDEASSGTIVVIGQRLVETRTSEVATNVSQQQIRRLPQTDRNFLAFTQLAPGVKYNDSETNRGFQSGASTGAAVNVFTGVLLSMGGHRQLPAGRRSTAPVWMGPTRAAYCVPSARPSWSPTW